MSQESLREKYSCYPSLESSVSLEGGYILDLIECDVDIDSEVRDALMAHEEAALRGQEQ